MKERDVLEQEWAAIQGWLEQVVDVVGGQSQATEGPLPLPGEDHRQSRFRRGGDVEGSKKTDMKHTVTDLMRNVSEDQSELYQKSKNLVYSCNILEKELSQLLSTSQNAINEGEALKENITKTTQSVQ